MLIAIAAVLIGLLIRGVQLAREAARFAEMQARLTGAYCDALHAYFKQHGMYPRTLTDPALDGYMPEIPGTSNRYTPAQIADTLGFKVDYSVTPGTRGNESEWDFSLCAVQRSTTRTGCMNRKCQFKTSANTPIGLPAGAIARV